MKLYILYLLAWIISGFSLGYLHSVRLKNSGMTVNDIIIACLGGPIQAYIFYLHFKDDLVIKAPKVLVGPEEPKPFFDPSKQAIEERKKQ